jgi:PPOX class probable F420-dependent enzyme
MEASSPYRPPREVVSGSGREERDLLSDELARELIGARLIATLATLNADGSVHLVPLWYLWSAPHVLLPTSHATRKVRNLERDPRATLMIDDSRGGLDLRGITLTGEVEIDRGPDARETNRAIHLKYLTTEGRGLQAVEDYLGTDDVTLRFLPRRVSSWNLRDTSQGEQLRTRGGWRALD